MEGLGEILNNGGLRSIEKRENRDLDELFDNGVKKA